MINRKARDFEQRHQWREVANAYAKLLELYEKCDTMDQFAYKGVAAVIDFLVTAASIPTPDGEETNSHDEEMRFDKAKELLCSKLLKGGLKSVSADIRKLYINQCRQVDFDKVMGWPWEGVEEDSSVVVDDLLFGYTELHKEITGDKNREMKFRNLELGEDWYSPDILGWTPFHYGIHQYKSNFEVKTEKVNIERVSKMKDSANRTLLDHVLMQGLKCMVNTFMSTYSASSLQSGREGFLSLHWAAVSGYGDTMVSVLDLLTRVEREKLVFQGDFWGRTALHLAASRGHHETVQGLLDWATRASIEESLATEADNKGRTALHLAAFGGHAEVVERLLASQPWDRIIRRDKSEYTALHMAVEALHDKVVEKILDSLRSDDKGEGENNVGKPQYWSILDLYTHEKERSQFKRETVLDIARRREREVEQQMVRFERNTKDKEESQDHAGLEPERPGGLPQDDLAANIDLERREIIKAQEDKVSLTSKMASIKSIFKSLFQGENDNSEESAKRLLWAVKVECQTGFDVLLGMGVKHFVHDKQSGKTILHIAAKRGYVDRYVCSTRASICYL
jgi:ankyrin repeat protein